MANLFGLIRGSRGEATRLGSRELIAVARAWDSGVTVLASATTPELREFVISEDGGSNGTGGSFALGKIEQNVASGRVQFALSSRMAEHLNELFRQNGELAMGDRITLKEGWQ